MGWAVLWVIFSQTHLVTLIVTESKSAGNFLTPEIPFPIGLRM
jgi:hypothetical protein